MEQRPLGFSLGFAPSRYQLRTPGRGPILNTDQESRFRHYPNLQSTYSLNACDLVSHLTSADEVFGTGKRAAAADRLTRQVMAEADASQPGSRATNRPLRRASRGLGEAQVLVRAEQQLGVTDVQPGVMPELRSAPEPAQAGTAPLEKKTGAYAQSTRAGTDEPVRPAEFPARGRLEPQAWQPPAADISPQWEAQAEVQVGEQEIEL